MSERRSRYSTEQANLSVLIPGVYIHTCILYDWIVRSGEWNGIDRIDRLQSRF